jgi:hypothetical protein
VTQLITSQRSGNRCRRPRAHALRTGNSRHSRGASTCARSSRDGGCCSMRGRTDGRSRPNGDRQSEAADLLRPRWNDRALQRFLFCGPFVRAPAADHNHDHDVFIAQSSSFLDTEAYAFRAHRAFAVQSHRMAYRRANTLTRLFWRVHWGNPLVGHRLFGTFRPWTATRGRAHVVSECVFLRAR